MLTYFQTGNKWYMYLWSENIWDHGKFLRMMDLETCEEFLVEREVADDVTARNVTFDNYVSMGKA